MAAETSITPGVLTEGLEKMLYRLKIKSIESQLKETQNTSNRELYQSN